MPKKLNLEGKLFGRLLVIEESDISTRWVCRCTCGSELIVKSRNLTSGKTKSCGCLSKEKSAANGRAATGKPKYARVDLTDKVFGRLTVIEQVPTPAGVKKKWLCVCTCGNIVIVIGTRLLNGRTNSCGCIRKETATETILRVRNYINFNGASNPNYNPLLSDEDREFGRGIEGYKEWRLSVYKKDKFSCIRCGSKRKINAHHLEDYASNPSLRTDVTNGVTLCATCHTEFHKIYGSVNSTYTWQLLEFLSEGERTIC